MDIATITMTENEEEEVVARFTSAKKLNVIQLDAIRSALLQVAETLHKRIVEKAASMVPIQVADD